MTSTKYHNKRSVGADGFVYDSKHEHHRYAELLLLQRAGEISNLQRQVKFTLIPDQRDENGKIVERKVDYIADFVYTDKHGNTVVEDAKSDATKTRDYTLKRKLMLYIYNIRVVEV